MIIPKKPSRYSPKNFAAIAPTRVDNDNTASNSASVPDADKTSDSCSLPRFLKSKPSPIFTSIAKAIIISE